MKTFYNFMIAIGIICTMVLGALFCSKYGWSWGSMFGYMALVLGIEFGCFAARDKRHEFGS